MEPKSNGSGRLWTIIGVVVAAVALIGSGAGFVMRMGGLEGEIVDSGRRIAMLETNVTSLSETVIQLRAQYSALAQQGAAVSSTQQVRAGLIQENAERISILRTDVTRLAADLREIETQFCASDIIRNLMHAHEMRIETMLWSAVNPKMPLPTDNAYYPMVCNRQQEQAR